MVDPVPTKTDGWISRQSSYVDVIEGTTPEDEQQDVGDKGGQAFATITPSQLGALAAAPPKEDIETAKLDQLIGQSNQVLCNIKAFFPFDLFPDQVTIDENKVNIIEREFFWSEYIHSVMIKDIMNVVVETGIFFATIKITPIGNKDNPITVTYLKKHEAICARRIIQGLITAKKSNIDLSVLPIETVKEKLHELGRSVDTLENKM